MQSAHKVIEKKTITSEALENPIRSSELQRLKADAFASGRVTSFYAVFGIGLSRGIAGALGQALNEMDVRYPLDVVPRVAVDLPSGLDADSGKVLGAVVAATVSVTFHRRKPVHLIRPDLCGRVERVDIGL